MLNILLKAEKASSKTKIHIGRLDISTCKHSPIESSGLGTNGYSITIWPKCDTPQKASLFHFRGVQTLGVGESFGGRGTMGAGGSSRDPLGSCPSGTKGFIAVTYD